MQSSSDEINNILANREALLKKADESIEHINKGLNCIVEHMIKNGSKPENLLIKTKVTPFCIELWVEDTNGEKSKE